MQVDDGRVGDQGAHARLVRRDAGGEVAAEADAHQRDAARVGFRALEHMIQRQPADLLVFGHEGHAGMKAQRVHLPRAGEQHQVVAALERRAAVGQPGFLQRAVVAADDHQRLAGAAAGGARAHVVRGQRRRAPGQRDLLDARAVATQGGQKAFAALESQARMLGALHTAVVLGSAVAVARDQVLLARADGVAAPGALARVGLLARGGGAERCHPAGRHAVLYAPRQREALAHRRAAVARRAQLAHQLEVHLGVGEAGHAGAAALQLAGGLVLRGHGQDQAGGGGGHEGAAMGGVQARVVHDDRSFIDSC